MDKKFARTSKFWKILKALPTGILLLGLLSVFVPAATRADSDTDDTNAVVTTSLSLSDTVTTGGAATSLDWTLTATGASEAPTNLTGSSTVSSGPGFLADTYTLGEIGDSNTTNYTPGTWSCTGGSLSDNTLTLASGDSASCSIVNTYVAPATPPTPPQAQCTVVSDVTTQVAGRNSVLVSIINSLWTAVLNGGSWIWGEDPVTDTTVNTTEEFTKTFYLTSVPTDASLSLAADNTYTVSVNGHDITPPSASQEDNFSTDTVIAIPPSDLNAGTNTIVFDVTNIGVAGSDEATNPAGLLYTLTVDGSTCATPPPANSINVIATKVVCDTDAEMPHWGLGGHVIASTTAMDWVATHPDCHLEPNWNFEWGNQNAGDMGDAFTGPAGIANGYTEFGPTSTNGSTATTTIPLTNISEVHLREVLEPGYIPFTFDEHPDNSASTSAEFYCANDALNYDNWDFIRNPQAGNTYYCVAFNVPVTPAPTCQANVNLLTNPSFETPTVTQGSWNVFPSGTSGLGWIVAWLGPYITGRPAVANIEIQDGYSGWTAADGNQWAELDSDWNGPSGPNGMPSSISISQNISTIPGDTYTFSFSFSARPGTAASENAVEALANGVALGTVGPTDGTSLENTAWTPETFTYVANSTSTVFTLQDAGSPNDSIGPEVDNTDLTCSTGSDNGGGGGNTPPNPTYLKVHIYKFLDSGNGATQIENNSGIDYEFPMVSTWQTANLNGGISTSGNYVLGNGWGQDSSSPSFLDYQADTSSMEAPADYTTHEITSDVDSTSEVLPTTATCMSGKYRLEGYKVGDTLSDAESASLSTTTPNLTGLTSDESIIVVNEQCPNPSTTSNLVTVKEADLATDASDVAESPSDWFFANDITNTIDDTLGSFVDGPATAPLNLGSAQISVAPNVETVLDTLGYGGTRLDHIMSLSYTTYRSEGTSDLALALQFDINPDMTVATTSYDGRLVYEPYYTHTVADNTWQTWNPMDNSTQGSVGNWWFSKAWIATETGCTQAAPCTWNQVLTKLPNIGISTDGETLFKAGGWSDAFTGNVDDFAIGVENTADTNINTTTYDFEPTAVTPDITPNIINGGGGGGGGAGTTGQVLGTSTSTNGLVPSVLGASCGPILSSYLRIGHKNPTDQVDILQNFLNGELGLKIPVTGFFGILTEKAVDEFQTEYNTDVLVPWLPHGLPSANDPTGYVYKTTKWKINMISCPELNLSIPTLP